MATSGTEACTGLPELVQAAVELARSSGFAYSCIPEQGDLFAAAGARRRPGRDR